MNPKLRAFLLENGLRAEATEAEAWDYYRTLQADGIQFEGPEKLAARDGQRAAAGDPVAPAPVAPAPAGGLPAQGGGSPPQDNGFARAVEILALCERHGVEGERRAALLRPEVTLDQARQMILDELATRSARQRPGFAPAPMAEVGVDERDKFRAAVQSGLFLRAALPLDGERGLDDVASACGWTLDGARAAGRDYIGFSLREIARECLQRAGQPTGGDPLQMIGRAMTTSDLPVLMANVANKSLFEGYAAANETWEIWADGTGSVPDFKTNTLAQISEFDDLEQIVNDTGYKYGDREDDAETYQLATFGKLSAITRTTIINDDLGALTDTYMSMGEAAARKIGDLPYAVLTANGNMRDGKALFHADHKNIGTSAVVSEASMGEAIKLAALQKDLKGKKALNIPLLYFIGPRSIEGTAEIFFASANFTGTDAASTRTNIYGGNRFIRAYDARLDAVSAATYFFAGPKRKTVRVFFLNGNRTPYLEARTGWTTDGVEYKVRIDAAAKAVDWKALVRNAGG